MPALMVCVVGASARAAVYSLARAGLAGSAVDLFGDRDLTGLAAALLRPIHAYPEALPGLVEQLPSGPIIYTGGLENHPDVVASLALARPLWGNLPDVLKRIRDPFWLSAATSSGVGVPQLIATGEPAPASGRWLRKPRRSSGGRGIRFAHPGEAASPHHYFQEWIEGRSCSAQFVTGGEMLTTLLGVTEQLIGESWLYSVPFAYCGNIGALDLSHEIEVTLRKTGADLARHAGLRGLWGMDFILDGTRVYPLEINPRYTAAMEVLELAGGFSCMVLHEKCFVASQEKLDRPAQPDPEESPSSIAKRALVGKAIYYAPHRIAFPASGPWDDDLSCPVDPWRVPGYADIPQAGAVIEPGSPVLTIFRAGSSAADCRERLQSAAAELDHLWRGST